MERDVEFTFPFSFCNSKLTCLYTAALEHRAAGPSNESGTIYWDPPIINRHCGLFKNSEDTVVAVLHKTCNMVLDCDM